MKFTFTFELERGHRHEDIEEFDDTVEFDTKASSVLDPAPVSDFENPGLVGFCRNEIK
jgi:hypothetical protein